MEFITAAWKRVSPSTIAKCFHNAGFSFGHITPTVDEAEEPEHINDDDLDEAVWNNYVHYDDEIAVCGDLGK